mmetsp:Transcript_24869/g.58731  ORF Transcript_24869/g.58731 Transcript_24869/m.58731 type:complete len:316 (-) Transcript_24869:1793-2740(-)
MTCRNVMTRSLLAGHCQVLTNALDQSRLSQLQLIRAVPSLRFKATKPTTHVLDANVVQHVPKAPSVIRGCTARDIVKGSSGVFRTRSGSVRGSYGLSGTSGVHNVDVQRGNVAIEGDSAQQSGHSRRGGSETFRCLERVGRSIFFWLRQRLSVAACSILERFAGRLSEGKVLVHVLGCEEKSHGVELLVPDRWHRCLSTRRHVIQIRLDAIRQTVQSYQAHQSVRSRQGSHIVATADGIVAHIRLFVTFWEPDLELEQQMTDIFGPSAQGYLNGTYSVLLPVLSGQGCLFDKSFESQNCLPQFHRGCTILATADV